MPRRLYRPRNPQPIVTHLRQTHPLTTIPAFSKIGVVLSKVHTGEVFHSSGPAANDDEVETLWSLVMGEAQIDVPYGAYLFALSTCQGFTDDHTRYNVPASFIDVRDPDAPFVYPYGSRLDHFMVGSYIVFGSDATTHLGVNSVHAMAKVMEPILKGDPVIANISGAGADRTTFKRALLLVAGWNTIEWNEDPGYGPVGEPDDDAPGPFTAGRFQLDFDDSYYPGGTGTSDDIEVTALPEGRAGVTFPTDFIIPNEYFASVAYGQRGFLAAWLVVNHGTNRVPSITPEPGLKLIAKLVTGGGSSDPTVPLGRNIGFIRQADAFPGNQPPWELLRYSGYGGIAARDIDPNCGFLIQRAREESFEALVWTFAENDVTAMGFANQVKAIEQAFHPDRIVLDIEFRGKGINPSVNWTWNDDAADAMGTVGVSTPLVVNPLGNQDDFNYAAWTNIGCQVWPQCYGADPATEPFDASAAFDRVVANGVSPTLVVPTLAAFGNSAAQISDLEAHDVHAWALYTIDDWNTVDQEAGHNALPSGGPVPPGPPGDDPWDRVIAFYWKALPTLPDTAEHTASWTLNDVRPWEALAGIQMVQPQDTLPPGVDEEPEEGIPGFLTEIKSSQ